MDNKIKLLNTFIKNHFLLLYSISFTLIFIYSLFFGYSFDESVFSSYSAQFYYYGSNPLSNWAMGAYYSGINIASYFPSIILNIFGFRNVLVEELGVKISIDLAFFISGLLIYRILKTLEVDDEVCKLGAYLFIFSPLLFFYAPFHGNPLDVTLMFLLGAFYLLMTERYKFSLSLLAIASASYLYPVFLFPIFLIYMYKKTNLKNLFSFVLIYLTILGIGLGTQFLFIFFHVDHISGTTIFNSSSGVASLSFVPFSPSNWNILYFTNIFNLHSSYFIFQLIFVSVMSFPIFLLIWKIIKSKVTLTDVLIVMAFQGLVFALFTPASDPQYLLAAFPFILILSLYQKRILPLIFLYISTLFGIIILAFVTPYNFNQYFVDVNRSASSIQLFITPYNLSLLSVIYALLGILIFFSLYKMVKEKYRVLQVNHYNIKLKRLAFISLLVISLFSVVTLVIISPGLDNLPNEFSFQQNASIQSIPTSNFTHSFNNYVFDFNLPGSYKMLPGYIKNDTSTGIYLRVSDPTENIGIIARNAIFPFNSTHYIFENFSVTDKAFIRSIELGFINNSYNYSKVIIAKGNIFNQNYSVIESFSTKSDCIKYYDTYPINEREYTLTQNISKYINPGNYSIIIEGTTSKTYYLGGWDGDSGKQGINSIGVIGIGNEIVKPIAIKNLRISLLVFINLYNNISIIVNSHEIQVPKFSYNCTIIKIPNKILMSRNSVLLTYNSLVNVNATISIIYFDPFPNNGNVEDMNISSLVFGGSIFIGLSIIYVFYIRKIIISFKDR